MELKILAIKATGKGAKIMESQLILMLLKLNFKKELLSNQKVSHIGFLV